MKLQLLQDLNIYGPSTLIFFNPDPMISNKLDEKQDLLKFEIKTHLGKINRKTVSLYIPIFNTGSTKEIPKFLVISNNTLKGHNLTTVLQMYAMTKNLLEGDALRFLKRNIGHLEKKNYKLQVIHQGYDDLLLPSKVYSNSRRCTSFGNVSSSGTAICESSYAK